MVDVLFHVRSGIRDKRVVTNYTTTQMSSQQVVRGVSHLMMQNYVTLVLIRKCCEAQG